MDRVRFGRALGKGARLAARTAVEAVEAASAPTPKPRSAPIHGNEKKVDGETIPPSRSARTVGTVIPPVASRVGPAARVAGSRFVGPLRNASRALWLELTGSFFSLFALSFGLGAWRDRTGASSAATVMERHRFEAFVLLSAVFAYFAVSSFVRARKRSA
jgi:hypothetical protein